MPRLPGASAIGATILDDKAVSARWLLNDGRELRIDLNLGEKDLVMDSPWSTHRILYSHRVSTAHYRQNILPAYSALASLEHPHPDDDEVKTQKPESESAEEEI